MVLAKCFFANLQGALVKRRCPGVVTHTCIQRCEVIQAIGCFRVVRPVMFLAILQHLFGNRHCFLELAGVAQLIDLLNHITHLGVGLSWSGSDKNCD